MPARLSRSAACREPTTIKLTVVEPKEVYKLLLRFSDGSARVFSAERYVEAGAKMTKPLRDPLFFARYLIEKEALA